MAHTHNYPPAPARPSGSFRLGRLFGIELRAHWSWLIIVGLLTWSIQAGSLLADYPDWTARQRWSVGLLVSLLFFGSVLAHELAHALVARRRGHVVAHITLYLFGGAAALADEPARPRDELWISLAGPLASVAAAAGFGALWLAARALDAGMLAPLAAYLAFMNASVALFNLLPAFPLDGGRMVRAALWARKGDLLGATRIAGIAGQGIAALLVAAGLLQVLTGGMGGVWLMLLGWYLWGSASASYQRLLVTASLGSLPVAPFVNRQTPRVPPDLTVQQFVDGYVLPGHTRAAFVAATEEGDVFGLITLDDVQQAPRETWASTSVYRAMTPRDRLVSVAPTTEALRALETMAAHRLQQVPVFQGREAVGLLTLAALAQAVQLRRAASR